MNKKPLVILGAGGFAREAFSWLPHDHYQVEAFYSDKAEQGQNLFGVPVLADLEPFRGAEFLIAVGDPQVKVKLHNLAASRHGLKLCDPIIHPTAVVGWDCRVGRGSIVCPQAVLTTNVELGLGVLVNLGVTIGHDSEIFDFATLSPGANVSGNCKVGQQAYIGTNACLREGIGVEAFATVGMGAVVVKNVPRGTTWVGNPARQRSVVPVA